MMMSPMDQRTSLTRLYPNTYITPQAPKRASGTSFEKEPKVITMLMPKVLPVRTSADDCTVLRIAFSQHLGIEFQPARRELIPKPQVANLPDGNVANGRRRQLRVHGLDGPSKLCRRFSRKLRAIEC